MPGICIHPRFSHVDRYKALLVSAVMECVKVAMGRGGLEDCDF